MQHDNARIHVAKPVKSYLELLKWEVLQSSRTGNEIFRPAPVSPYRQQHIRITTSHWPYYCVQQSTVIIRCVYYIKSGWLFLSVPNGSLPLFLSIMPPHSLSLSGNGALPVWRACCGHDTIGSTKPCRAPVKWCFHVEHAKIA